MLKSILLKNPSIADINRTYTLYSPVCNRLVRTGTIGDGSCLVHSILRSIDSEYNNLPMDKKMDYVRDKRILLGNITMEKWEKLSGGMIALISFQESILKFIESFYMIVNKYQENPKIIEIVKNNSVLNILNKTGIKLGKYLSLTKKIPIDMYEKEILPASYGGTNTIRESMKEIVAQSEKYLVKNGGSDDELRDCKTMIVSIVEESYKFSYSMYLDKMVDTRSHLDSNSIELLSDMLDVDLYFLDAATRLPYRGIGVENIKGRKSVIVVWIKHCHYECGGLLIGDNVVKRSFEPDDPLILKFKAFLYDSKAVISDYPELVEFLPMEDRKGN
jgi:hypothetical protein